jgi:hypothetical protein
LSLGLPQLYQRPRRLFHPHHSPLHRQRHRQLNRQRNRQRDRQRRLRRRRPHGRGHPFRPHSRLRPLDLWIRTTAQLANIPRGMAPRRSGAAESTISVMGFRDSHQPLQIPTIALMALPIGRLAGAWPKRNGVAGFMARVAQTRAVDVPQSALHPLLMIVRQVLQIGWQAGPLRRKRGAAVMLVRVAHRQPEGAHEQVMTLATRTV